MILKPTLKQLKYKMIQLIVKQSNLLNRMNKVNQDMKDLDLLIAEAKKNEAINLMSKMINL